MVKPVFTGLLTLCCLLLIMANINTFLATSSEQAETTVKAKKSVKRLKPLKPLAFNPRMSPQLPDLGNGYLFNADRLLAKGARSSRPGKGYGKNIKMDDVVFIGAILGEGYQKALVSYSLAPKPVSRSTKQPRLKQTSTKSDETVQLDVGDSLAGYTVKEITADFILFIKGSDTIKKTLFDPNKTRQQVTPRAAKPQTLQTKPGVVPPRRIQPPPPPRP